MSNNLVLLTLQEYNDLKNLKNKHCSDIIDSANNIYLEQKKKLELEEREFTEKRVKFLQEFSFLNKRGWYIIKTLGLWGKYEYSFPSLEEFKIIEHEKEKLIYKAGKILDDNLKIENKFRKMNIFQRIFYK